MRVAGLGSGSGGNATLVEAGTTRLLIDCGFSLRELCGRLARAGTSADALSAVFVTHEHGDHVGCALALARRHRVPLVMSRGTWIAIGAPELPDGLLRFARDGDPLAIGALEITPVAVPHDAGEPLQLRCTDGAATLGVLTDCGSVTAEVVAGFQRVDALVLECNHDREMLAASRYPWPLKRRIAGPRGHLANDSAAEILAACAHGALRHVVAAHLSRENNRPALAQAALAAVLGTQADEIVVADQALGFGWLDV